MVAAGSAGLAVLLLLPATGTTKEGLLYLLVGTSLFGLGEILNHRKTEDLRAGDQHPGDRPSFHRRRIPCSLGNLSDIVAILLFFIGLSDLLFPR